MTESEYRRAEEEVDRLLNDPETPMRPDRVWALLEDLARRSSDGVSAGHRGQA